MPSNIVKNYSAFSTFRLRQRELGFPTPIGAGNALSKSIYTRLTPMDQWESTDHGGVFNMEFSPEGSLMVAACEKKSVLMFDPLNRKNIYTIHDAHNECVNCVKFLDSRTFATCSDDHKIALWDVRNPTKKIRTLLGHSNWVKNIEYSPKDKMLITLGLEGSIFTWDINSYTEVSVLYHCVFHSMGLMRCRLSPDCSKMVMCTTGGLIIIVHDLNLNTLAQDIYGFKPNMYRLMQMSRQHIPIAAAFNHLFDPERKQNRVEFVSDFPEANDAAVISSLQIHPQGWCALSRNTSHEERNEWTCVHDIQPKEPTVEDTKPITPVKRRVLRFRQNRRMCPVMEQRRQMQLRRDRENTAGRAATSRSDDEQARADPQAPAASIQNDVWEASITIRQYRMLQEMTSRGQAGRSFHMQRITGINTGITPPASADDPTAAPVAASTRETSRTRPSTSAANTSRRSLETNDSITQLRIRQNEPRLLYYVEEVNEGKGFIKELCFSSDGRLICSPFGYGVRMFAMDENCSELSSCVDESQPAKQLVQIGQSIAHSDIVVSSKFSPTHDILVTGCLAGKIVWYQPLL